MADMSFSNTAAATMLASNPFSVSGHARMLGECLGNLSVDTTPLSKARNLNQMNEALEKILASVRAKKPVRFWSASQQVAEFGSSILYFLPLGTEMRQVDDYLLGAGHVACSAFDLDAGHFYENISALIMGVTAQESVA